MRIRLQKFAIILLLIILISGIVMADANEKKVYNPLSINASQAIDGKITKAQKRVIVLYKDKINDDDEISLKSRGARIKHRLNLIKAIAADLNDDEIENLKLNNKVKAVFEDMEVHTLLSSSMPQIGANQVHAAGINGSGIKVCIVDTGVDDSHPNIDPLVAEIDYVNNDNDAMDDNGHGTHVAGIVASKNPIYRGVAYGSSLIAAKVLDSSGSGWSSDVIAGIDWCAANGADVISMSLGGGTFTTACDSEPIAQASNNAVDNGVVVFAASGNDGYINALSAPACASKVIAVGAVDKNDARTSYSNEGAELDLVAPGSEIKSTYLFVDDFSDGSIDISKWSTLNAQENGKCSFKSSPYALYFTGSGTRSTTTKSLDVSNGGILSFYLKFGTSTSSSGCENADNGEDVVLEYSTNSGSSWTIIRTYDTEAYTSFSGITENVPVAAKTPSTIFRWRQLIHSGGNYDNWAIDDFRITGGFLRLTGTSMATPHASGSAALVLQTNPSLTPLQVKNILQDTAVDLGVAGFDNIYGYGRVDAYQAYQFTSGINQTLQCSADAECNDGLYCNGIESCQGGTCQSGINIDCSPLNGQCNTDACDEATDSCEINPSNEGISCNDGLFCNTGEKCQAGTCAGGSLSSCSDGNECTADSCDESADKCVNSAVADGTSCNNGLFCTINNFCASGVCSGVARDCADNISCTADSCSESNDVCINTPINSICSDGLFCNGAEVCDAGLGCISAQPVTCDDANSCTTDSCNENADACNFVNTCPQQVQCWKVTNQYLVRSSSQFQKFCKCAQGTYSFVSFGTASGTKTAYKYTDANNNNNWGTTAQTQGSPASRVRCSDNVLYYTNKDYYR